MGSAGEDKEKQTKRPFKGWEKNFKKVLVVWKTFSTFAIPNREKREAQETSREHITTTFE
ncbi:hypothetical protein IO90_18925 [Chryseobacterium sp. FH1]|nr:hypothetical protein IO90_18925 [Chryseobacterium sp. FH1]